MSDGTSSMSDLRSEASVIKALKGRRGRATLGDIVVDTGLPKAEAEKQIRRLLKEYDGHLEVDESGDIAYKFSPSWTRRSQRGAMKRRLRKVGIAAWKAFRMLFKVAIMVTLVVYFVLFVVLLIAAFVAMASRGGSSSSSSSSRRGSFPMIFVGRMFGRRSGYGSGYGSSSAFSGGSTRRRESSDEGEDLAYYKRIFAYVFGPEANDDEPADPFSDEKTILTFIRAQRGVVTAAELSTRTGWGVEEAEERIASLLSDYDGDVRVTNNGTILYTFHGLAKSAGNALSKMPPPVWKQFEKAKALTGNGTGTNLLITFLNGFNLIGAWIAPIFIMPQLQLEGPAVYFGLSIFPFLFSTVFFAVPFIRWIFLRFENARRETRNHWRFVMAEVHRAAEHGEAVSQADIVESVERSYPSTAAGEANKASTLKALKRAVVDHNADVEANRRSGMQYTFGELGRELHEGKRARSLVDDAQLRLGRIVFSSDGDDLGLDQLDDFERQISGEPDRVPANRLAQIAPELDAFDAQIQGPPVDKSSADALDDFEKRLAQAAPATSQSKK